MLLGCSPREAAKATEELIPPDSVLGRNNGTGDRGMKRRIFTVTGEPQKKALNESVAKAGGGLVVFEEGCQGNKE